MSDELLARITVDPEIMFGKPVIKGTRLTVELILEKLGNGQSEADIILSYPFITKEDIRACIIYAARSLSLEEIKLVA